MGDGVWAIGDVIGGIMLAHVASYEGVCAVENIAGHADRIPTTTPRRTASTPTPRSRTSGSARRMPRRRDRDSSRRFPFAASGRALTLGQSEGYVKVLADAESESFWERTSSDLAPPT